MFPLAETKHSLCFGVKGLQLMVDFEEKLWYKQDGDMLAARQHRVTAM